ncbi:MAG TPA: class I SAM-dependent methyltransferase [Vicinamibacterales bacterium]|nr:class I SAM-dependent methyltransferase [Vicinamibacterales bacterium]
MTFRSTLDRLRARFPTAYWRGRNALALAQFYAFRLRAGTPGADAYDDAFWDFHSPGDWKGFARVILQHVPARSIADIGCGQGLVLDGFAQLDSTLQLKGYDESPAALRRAQSRNLSVVRLDFLALSAASASTLAADLTNVDLAVCLEVAEHLPAWHSHKLLTVISAPRALVFSAAHPNQGGRYHVNEQPAEHWVAQLAARGLRLAANDADFRHAVAALDLPWWYRQNIHLFERRDPGSG